jgi:hypothetical protein
LTPLPISIAGSGKQVPLTLDFDTLALLNQRVRCTLQSIITYHLTTNQLRWAKVSRLSLFRLG